MSDLPQGTVPTFQKRVVLFPEAVIVLDLKSTINNEDKQNIQTALQKVLSTGSVTNIQYLALKKDGSMLRVSFSGTLIHDNQGNPQEIICVLHDITPHLSELEQVREAQRQLSEAQQIAHFGSWEWDIPTNKLHWTDVSHK